MRESKTKYVILGLLTEAPLTGYEIKRIIDIRFSFFWNESYGQLYPMLRALRDEGLIAAAEGGARAQIRYALTAAGREALISWLAAPVETETVRFELLLKMYFSGQANRDTIAGHIRAFRDHHAARLATLDAFERELLPIAHSHNHADVLRVIAFGQKTYRASLEWCDETLSDLEEKGNEA